MPALNFREIAPANEGPNRDQFEQFAREFLLAEGFEVLEGPDRGPDGGRDLIVREVRQGPGGINEVRWLVSCKHKAHSGSAVGQSEEINIRDRLEQHRCDGFIAFYSALASSTLAGQLRSLSPRYSVIIFDNERIEAKLLDSPRGRSIAVRFMPISFQRWVIASQYAASPSPPTPLPINDRFFLRTPHSDLALAAAEAGARNVPLFVVIYDERHSSRSRLDYCLGWFMEFETTKRLVDEHFVVLVGSSSIPELAALVPADDPLEECRLVVQDQTRKVIYSESVYANSSEGLKRVRRMIAAMLVRN